jgi:acyl carrier protein
MPRRREAEHKERKMRDELRALMVKTYEAELGDIELTDDLNLFENGIVDSFALTTFVAALEQKYDLRIADSDATLENLGSVKLTEIYMKSRLG